MLIQVLAFFLMIQFIAFVNKIIPLQKKFNFGKVKVMNGQKGPRLRYRALLLNSGNKFD